MGWRARRAGAGWLGIGLLILSLVHIPLPEPDFHNIRHHDGRGEVCEHHDHLLRWHPGAGAADDVAVLHWHWFVPLADSADRGLPGSSPAVHAHVIDWFAPSWDDAPRVLPDDSVRLLGRLAAAPLAALVDRDETFPLSGSDMQRVPGMRALASRGPLRLALLQRWIC